MSFRQGFRRLVFNRAFFKEFSFRMFTFVSWVPVAIFIQTKVVDIAKVNGPSMYPYLNTDYNRNMKSDYCLCWKWNPTEDLKKGMIIVFWSPWNPEHRAVKRVIAVEGDVVQTHAPFPHPTMVVPHNHVWVEGDAGSGSGQSLDSNTYGPISKSLIIGQITHVVWPPKSFGPVNWWEYRGKTKVWRAPGL